MSTVAGELNSQLVDWLTETVVLATDPQHRAARICAIVELWSGVVAGRGPWS